MRHASFRQTDSGGYIATELNDVLTSLCVLGAVLIARPNVFNWSASLWLAALSPVALPALFQFLIWGTEARPSIRRAHEKQLEEAIAYLHQMFEERPEIDPAQHQTLKQEIPKPALPAPKCVPLLTTRQNVPRAFQTFYAIERLNSPEVPQHFCN